VRKKAIAGLLTASFLMASTFPLQKSVVATVSPFSYNVLRFGIASLISFFLFGAGDYRGGVLLGMILSGGYIFQLWGLKYTTASKGGFIVSLYVVMVPIFSYFLEKERLRLQHIVGFFMAVLGSYLLFSGDSLMLEMGDLLMLGCAACFALHIVLITALSRRIEERSLLFYQFLTVALVNAFMNVSGRWHFSTSSVVVAVYCGIFATVLLIYIQLKYQKVVGSNATALIFVTQPVFSAVLSFLILGERLRFSQWMGGMLMLLASLVSTVRKRVGLFRKR